MLNHLRTALDHIGAKNAYTAEVCLLFHLKKNPQPKPGKTAKQRSVATLGLYYYSGWGLHILAQHDHRFW